MDTVTLLPEVLRPLAASSGAVVQGRRVLLPYNDEQGRRCMQMYGPVPDVDPRANVFCPHCAVPQYVADKLTFTRCVAKDHRVYGQVCGRPFTIVVGAGTPWRETRVM